MYTLLMSNHAPCWDWDLANKEGDSNCFHLKLLQSCSILGGHKMLHFDAGKEPLKQNSLSFYEVLLKQART